MSSGFNLRSLFFVLRSSVFVLRSCRLLSRFGFDAVAAGVSDAQYMLLRAEVSSLILCYRGQCPPSSIVSLHTLQAPLLLFLAALLVSASLGKKSRPSSACTSLLLQYVLKGSLALRDSFAQGSHDGLSSLRSIPRQST